MADLKYYIDRDKTFLDDLYSYLSHLQGGYAGQATRARNEKRMDRVPYFEALAGIVNNEKENAVKSLRAGLNGIASPEALLDFIDHEIFEAQRIRNFIVKEYPELERRKFITELNWYLERYAFKSQKVKELLPPPPEEEEVELIGLNTDTGHNIYYNKEKKKYFEISPDMEKTFITTKDGKTFLDITPETEELKYEDALEIDETISIDTGEGHEPFAAEVESRTQVTKKGKDDITASENDIQTSLDNYFHNYGDKRFGQIKSSGMKIGVEYRLGGNAPSYPRAKVLIEKTKPEKRKRTYPEEEVSL